MNFLSFFLILCLFFITTGSNGYRILAIFPFNSRSHNNVMQGVTKALARNGHQVDVVSHYNLKKPVKNYRNIINLEGTQASVTNNFSIEFADELLDSQIKMVSELYGNQLCELMGLPEMQNLIKNPPQDPPYDLLIAETFAAQCFIGIGHLFKIPVITVAATMPNPWTNAVIGNTQSAASVPHILSNLTEVSTFWNRLQNVIEIHQILYEFNKYTGDVQTKAMRKYLSPDMPNIREVEREVALTFFNSFHSINGANSKTPSAIETAGIHIEGDDTELPLELKKWMDESKDGVVHFTMGSMVLVETLPKKTILAFYEAFAKIAPIRVLMKIVNKEKLPPGLPSNVRLSKWIPQIPVMRHKNTRLFMTHGGLLSGLEALYHGIPTIAFPLFGDHFPNAHLLAKKNMSISLDYRTVTEDTLTKALNAVLYDPIYRESAKRESKLFRDRPFTASQTVNFWVEYVIRNGPNSLRSPTVDMYWWQSQLLDIYGFLTLCFLLILTLIITTVIFILQQIFKFFSSPNVKTTKGIKRD